MIDKELNNEGRRIGNDETDYVTHIRKTHCKGCLNEHGWCTAENVLMCWLRKTYLPEGEYEKAIQSDINTHLVNDITDEINKKILEDVMKKYKLYGH